MSLFHQTIIAFKDALLIQPMAIDGQFLAALNAYDEENPTDAQLKSVISLSLNANKKRTIFSIFYRSDSEILLHKFINNITEICSKKYGYDLIDFLDMEKPNVVNIYDHWKIIVSLFDPKKDKLYHLVERTLKLFLSDSLLKISEIKKIDTFEKIVAFIEIIILLKVAGLLDQVNIERFIYASANSLTTNQLQFLDSTVEKLARVGLLSKASFESLWMFEELVARCACINKIDEAKCFVILNSKNPGRIWQAFTHREIDIVRSSQSQMAIQLILSHHNKNPNKVVVWWAIKEKLDAPDLEVYYKKNILKLLSKKQLIDNKIRADILAVDSPRNLEETFRRYDCVLNSLSIVRLIINHHVLHPMIDASKRDISDFYRAIQFGTESANKRSPLFFESENIPAILNGTTTFIRPALI